MNKADDFSLKGVKVLVAEDDISIQKVVKFYLEKFGCVVDVVEDGRAAVGNVQNNEYDICFFDMNMPEMGGCEATQTIRQEKANNIPIIAMTAADSADDKEQCMTAGMDDIITKPIDFIKFKEMIAAYSKEGSLQFGMEQKEFLELAIFDSVHDAFTFNENTPDLIKDENIIDAQEGVFSTMDLTGNISGTTSIFVSKEYGSEIVSKMLNKKSQEFSEETLDGMGEILNIINGGIKTRCASINYQYEIGLPNTKVCSAADAQLSEYDNTVQHHYLVFGNIHFQITLSFNISSGEAKQAAGETTKTSYAVDLLTQLITKH